MRTVIAWADKVQERDGSKQCIYDLTFRPDGSQLIVAAGNRVLIYEASDGDLLQSLKGHKDTVYCVSYSKDGKRFASGGADKTVIIWTNKLEGILKYSHNDAIQCLAYNPVTAQLASCTASDFGLWSPEQKSVAKHKVSSRVLCCSWTNDGQFLALGHYNGNVSIRDKNGDERVRIERNAPVWCIAWNPSRDEPYDLLAVGDWDQKLAFYQLNGRQVGKDRELGFDPCSIGYFVNGEYLCIGGSDRKVSLWTKEGVKLTHIGEREDWVWACKPKPKQNYVAIGCNDGSISMYQLIFSTVHGLYQDRYAYRDFMTDVIVQHLLTEQKLRIKCRDYVKKIAIFKDRLAVQMPDKVVVYELFHDDAGELHYRVREKIMKKLECNLLVVTSNHIILCQEKTLQLFDFQGTREREWTMESQIRYIKVIGGQPNREGLLVGLKNGMVLKVFINNPFPIQLIKQNTSIRCLDLSASRQKLSVVDEMNMCMVYDLKSKELLFQEPNANSVAWNSEFEDMLCFSGNGLLNIKAGTFPCHSQKMQGFVVGFKGSKIFCLHIYAMQSIDVPQSASLYRYLEKKDFLNAYRIACLGVTDSDWELLAHEALENMSIDIARKAFIRIKDIRYLELISRMELMRAQPKYDDNLFLAEVMAYQGKYHEAAKLFVKAGHANRAVDMFSDLRMYDQAKLYAGDSNDSNVKDLIRKQANWSEEVGDVKSATDMYIAAGEVTTAITLLGEKSAVQELIDLASRLNNSEIEALKQCAAALKKLKALDAAKEIYQRIEDNEALLKIHVEGEKWEEAHTLVKDHPELSSDVFLPYAQWLAVNDRFEESEDAFLRAGKPEEAVKVLEQLTFNAVTEERYEDAAHYYWKLSIEELNMVKNTISELTKQDEKHVKRFRELQTKADIYFAYHHIHRFVGDPFTTTQPLALFNMSRFLLTKVSKNCPHGVSKNYILFAMSKMCKQLGAYKLARTAYDRLQTMRLPSSWVDEIDMASVTIRSKPFTDKDDLLPVCYRCSNSNPLLNSQGDVCVGCQQEFVRSFNSFDHLPLVEFILPDGLTDEQAFKLLDSNLVADANGDGGKKGSGYKETKEPKIQTLSFNTPEADLAADPFSKLLSETLDASEPIRVDESILRSFHRNEVFIKKWPSPAVKTQYYKSMVPEAPIILCPSCNRFFDEEEYELAYLQKGHCPFCRFVVKDKTH